MSHSYRQLLANLAQMWHTGVVKTLLIESSDKGPMTELWNGTPFPAWLTVRLEVDEGVLALLRFEVEAGRPELTRCAVDRVPGAPPLKPSVLHELPFGEIVERVVRDMGQFAHLAQRGFPEEMSFAEMYEFAQAGGRASSSLRGRPVADSDLDLVAEILQKNSFSPRKEVSRRLHVSERTASRWIKLARERALSSGENEK